MGAPLIWRLLTEPHRFDGFQALRILEALRAAERRLDATPRPAGGEDAAEFRSAISLEFPAADLQSISGPSERPVMTVNFTGLAGVMGPLPTPYTEFLLRAERNDPGVTAPRDFLDIFNHRLISLATALAKRFRPALQDPGRPYHLTLLKALAGLGFAELEALLILPDERSFAPSLVGLTALVRQRPVSGHAVERAVTAHFGLPARLVPFQGRWLALPKDALTRLGTARAGRRLGIDAIAGVRAWDQSAGVEIEIGPMPFERLDEFLPGGTAGVELAILLKAMLADHFDIRVRLFVDPATLPASRLGKGRRLGWTTWLGAGRLPVGASARLGVRPGARLGETARLGGGRRLRQPSTVFIPPPAPPDALRDAPGDNAPMRP